MGTHSNFRRSAAACLAAFAPLGPLVFSAPAAAETSPADCAELKTLFASFSIVVKDVLGPKDMQALASGGSVDEKKLDSTMDKRFDEVDPVTGKPRIELFLEHLLDLDALAHDTDGKFEDPEAALAVGKLRDGLDSYLDLIDRLKNENRKAADQDGSDGDSQAPSDKDSPSAPETEGSDKDSFGAETSLGDFNNGVDAFTDYVDKWGCHKA